jgi:hypothetical protein
MFIARAMCGLKSVTVAALCSSCSLQKYRDRWPAALREAGRSVLMLMKESAYMYFAIFTFFHIF